MAGINKVIIVGNVGNDPETRNFPSGGQVAEFSVATSEQWKDKQTGERKEKTHWHRIKILNDGLIDNVVRQYVQKGSLVGVEGELQTEEWEKNGVKHYATKVVVTAFRGTIYLLGGRSESSGGDRGQSRSDNRGSSGGGRSSNDSYGSSKGSQTRQQSFGGDAYDDDIPF